MDYKYITALLERYFQAETTLEEEQVLADYFQKEEVHASLKDYQPLFNLFREERQMELPASFEPRFTLPEQPARYTRLRFFRFAVRVAAVLLFMFGMYKLYVPAPAPSTKESAAIDWSKYEPETPEEAFKVTRSAMLRLSKELNKGAAAAAKEVDKINH